MRDLRVRWALEETGLSCRERLLNARAGRSETYPREQPFGQVPTYDDGAIRMIESGAIVLHLAERSEALAPSDPAGRARTAAWVLALMNSVETAINGLVDVDVFHSGEPWARERRPSAETAVRAKLACVSDWLGDRDWPEDRFTAGDLMMTTVLRGLRHTDLVAERPNLARYQARCEARPAFQRALAAQLMAFEPQRATA